MDWSHLYQSMLGGYHKSKQILTHPPTSTPHRIIFTTIEPGSPGQIRPYKARPYSPHNAFP